MPTLDSQDHFEDVEARREDEDPLRSSSGVQISGSPSSCRRGSNGKLTSSPPPVLIHEWLLSFSHYIAIYSTLITRLGTRCDCRKLRAKSEFVRRRSVNYARKCQESLLPIVDKAGVSLLGLPSGLSGLNPNSSLPSHRVSRKANLEDYYRLFFLHCTCLEFFISQLLRTTQLLQCFSLNTGRALTSSLVVRPPNFIYSGLAEVERPRKKRSQLMHRRSQNDKNNLVSDSLSGIELDLASRTSYGQTPSGDHDNHSSDYSHPTADASHTHSCLQEPQFSCSVEKVKIFSSCHCKILSFHLHPSMKPIVGRRKKFSPSSASTHGERKRRIVETDMECLEKLLDDIHIIHGMIREIQANAPMHPWKKRRKEPSKNQEEHDENILGDLDCTDEEDGKSFNAVEEVECGISQEIQRISFSSQCFYTNSKFRRWQRQWRNVKLTRVMRRNRLRRDNSIHGGSETILTKRIRRRQYICLSCIIAISIGLFGSALGSCIYLLA